MNEIQLTVIALARPPVAAETLAAFLSPDEEARAARFRFPELGARFRVGRGMLRFMLGQHSGVPPERLCFAYSELGKPSLPSFPEVHFNASHSGDVWTCAIGNAPLGIDVEQVRDMTDHQSIARRFFSPAEYESLCSIPPEERKFAFYRCWTRKEAYVKALGQGLARGLATFTVSAGDEEISSVQDTLNSDAWSVRAFAPAPGYVGAIAFRP